MKIFGLVLLVILFVACPEERTRQVSDSCSFTIRMIDNLKERTITCECFKYEWVTTSDVKATPMGSVSCTAKFSGVVSPKDQNKEQAIGNGACEKHGLTGGIYGELSETCTNSDHVEHEVITGD